MGIGMGFYIQTSGLLGKAEAIIEKYGAERLLVPPESFAAIPEGKALIVVVSNGPFEAAGFVYSQQEFEAIVLPNLGDCRPRAFLLMDRKLAEEITGYDKL